MQPTMQLTRDLSPTMKAPLRSKCPTSIGAAATALTFSTNALISPLLALAVRTASVSRIFFKSSSRASSSNSTTAMFLSRSTSSLGAAGFASGSNRSVPSFPMYSLPVTAPPRTASSASTGSVAPPNSRYRAKSASQSAAWLESTQFSVSAAAFFKRDFSDSSKFRVLARSGSKPSNISRQRCAMPYLPTICPATSVSSFRFAMSSASEASGF
mmetsp:Transcript_88601/g.223125  ORF Transcript_88601/g.223125 Transcript_88601/m.223125 type:complete len:213 (+) Transcript_88601:449-1087(+)